MIKDLLIAMNLAVMFSGYFFNAAMEERVICSGNQNAISQTVPYEISQFPVTTDGCYLEGVKSDWPGSPRITQVDKQGNNFSLKIRPPDNASAKVLRGILVKIFVTGEPLNLDPECCYFINLTKQYTPSEIINAVFSINCHYVGTSPSNITIYANSSPEPYGTKAPKASNRTIQVGDHLLSTKITWATVTSSQILQEDTTTPPDSTTDHDKYNLYVVLIIVFTIILICVIATVAVFLKWNRQRTDRFFFHTDE